MPKPEHPELEKGWEPASEEDLKSLYTKTRDWLTAHGRYQSAEGNEGFFAGIPVVRECAYYEKELDPYKLKQVAPRSIQALNITSYFYFAYYPNQFVYTDDMGRQPHPEDPTVYFNVFRDPEDPIYSESFSLRLEADQINAHKRRDMNDSLFSQFEQQDSVETKSMMDKVNDLEERFKLDRETGAVTVTQKEAEALLDIINGLKMLETRAGRVRLAMRGTMAKLLRRN